MYCVFEWIYQYHPSIYIISKRVAKVMLLFIAFTERRDISVCVEKSDLTIGDFFPDYPLYFLNKDLANFVRHNIHTSFI